MSRATDLLRRVARRALGRPRTPPADLRGARPAAPADRPPGDHTATPDGDPDGTPGELPLEVEVPVPGSLLIDIREPGELASGVAEGALLLPMDLVPHHLEDLPRDRPLTIYCAAGARSYGVAHWLREQGFPLAVSLAGGIGVFRAIDHPVSTPPGVVPGTRVRLPPDALAGAVPVGPGLSGEVIRQVGDHVEVVVHDDQGFPVRVLAAIAALG